MKIFIFQRRLPHVPVWTPCGSTRRLRTRVLFLNIKEIGPGIWALKLLFTEASFAWRNYSHFFVKFSRTANKQTKNYKEWGTQKDNIFFPQKRCIKINMLPKEVTVLISVFRVLRECQSVGSIFIANNSAFLHVKYPLFLDTNQKQ